MVLFRPGTRSMARGGEMSPDAPLRHGHSRRRPPSFLACFHLLECRACRKGAPWIQRGLGRADGRDSDSGPWKLFDTDNVIPTHYRLPKRALSGLVGNHCCSYTLSCWRFLSPPKRKVVGFVPARAEAERLGLPSVIMWPD